MTQMVLTALMTAVSMPLLAGDGEIFIDGFEGGTALAWSAAEGLFPSIDFMNIVLFADCQPVVPPDPIIVTFDATYDNSGGLAPATVTIAGARLVFAMSEAAIDVTPTIVGPIPAGSSILTSHQKTSLVGGFFPACDFCAQSALLEVSFESGPTVATAAQPFSCAF